MYLGLASLLFTCFSGLPAVVLGALALKKVPADKRTQALVGIASGSFMTLVTLAGLVVVILMPDRPKTVATSPVASAAAAVSASAATSASVAVVPEQPPTPKSPLEAWAARATPAADFKIAANESWALLPTGTTDCGVDTEGKVVHLDKPQSSDEFEAHRLEQQRDAVKQRYVGRLVAFGDKDVEVQFSSAYDFKTQTLKVTVAMDAAAIGSHWPLGSSDPTFRRETDTFDAKQKVGELGGKDLSVTGEQTLVRYETVPTSFAVHLPPEQAERWRNGQGQMHAMVVQRFLGLGFHKSCQNSCAHLLGTTQCSVDNVGVGEYSRADLVGYRVVVDDIVIAEKQPNATPPAP